MAPFFSTSLYLVTLLMLSQNTNLILMLIVLEMLSWCLATLIGPVLGFKYLLIQSYFMTLSLGALMWFPLVLAPLFLMKMGLPPVHSWIVPIMVSMKTWAFIFTTTIHKILPLLTLITLLSWKSLLLWSLGVTLLSLGLMAASSSLTLTLINSSMMNSGWMIVSSLLGAGPLLTYWLIYSSIMACLIQMANKTLSLTNLKMSSPLSGLMLIISGMPPFALFWLKAAVLMTLVSSALTAAWWLMTFMLLAMVAYYRVFTVAISSSSYQANLSVPGLSVLSLISIY